MKARFRSSSAAALLLVVGFANAARSEKIDDALAAESHRNRATLDAIPASTLVDSDRPRLRILLDDVDSYLKARRIDLAIEALSSAAPGVTALSRAGAGWNDSGKGPGKGMDDLAKEWEEAGPSLKEDRSLFASMKSGGQSAFVRAMAEQSFGQVDEYYAVAVDYGRASGVSSGAYYVGRARGQMDFALFLAQVAREPLKKPLSLDSLAPSIDAVDNEIVAAYAKPGSTAQHGNFILANSSLKLARELENHGWRFGSLVTLLRSLFALTLATLPPPPSDQDPVLAARADAFEKRFASSNRDDSIGQAFVEKARLALEKTAAGGEAAEKERLRAAALLGVVIPRYLEIMEAFAK